jgi:hypothetical protein
MKSKTTWIRSIFWLGAFVDFIVGVAMVHPELWAGLFNIQDFNPDLRYRTGMGVGASLMFGWTALLLWGSHKPVERRGVLLITAFPVVTGILLTTILSITVGLNTLASVASSVIFLPLLLVLLGLGYLKATRIANQARLQP